METITMISCSKDEKRAQVVIREEIAGSRGKMKSTTKHLHFRNGFWYGFEKMVIKKTKDGTVKEPVYKKYNFSLPKRKTA